MRLSEQHHKRVQDQYDQLAKLGITLNSHYSFEDLLQVIDHLGAVDMPTLVLALGGAYGRIPHFHLSDSIWLFDAECVEDPQAYADIAYRMMALTSPDLPLENIQSDLDFEADKAWLEFLLGGENYHWDLEVEGDWVDSKVFGNFAKLLAKANPEKALAGSADGQSSYIIYTSLLNLPRISAATGMNWEWLSEPPTVVH